MKELLEELVKVWPKDALWTVDAFGGQVLFRTTHLAEPPFHLWANLGDFSNAAARTIIEEELIRVGWLPVLGPTSKKQWVATATRTVVDELWKSPDSVINQVAPTRTEALIRVAIEAFQKTASGTNEKSPPG